MVTEYTVKNNLKIHINSKLPFEKNMNEFIKDLTENNF